MVQVGKTKFSFEGLLGSTSLFSEESSSEKPNENRLKSTAGRRMGQFTSPRTAIFGSNE